MALDLLSWKFCLALRLGSFSGEQQHWAEEVEVFYYGADPGTSGFIFFNFIWIMDADKTFQYLLFSLPLWQARVEHG